MQGKLNFARACLCCTVCVHCSTFVHLPQDGGTFTPRAVASTGIRRTRAGSDQTALTLDEHKENASLLDAESTSDKQLQYSHANTNKRTAEMLYTHEAFLTSSTHSDAR